MLRRSDHYHNNPPLQSSLGSGARSHHPRVGRKDFGLAKLAHCLSDSALQIDLNQGEALFQVGSCSSFRSEPQQSITWKKKDVLNESNRSCCKKSPLPFVFPTQFPPHLANVPAGLLCPLPNGAGGQSGAGWWLCGQQHR